MRKPGARTQTGVLGAIAVAAVTATLVLALGDGGRSATAAAADALAAPATVTVSGLGTVQGVPDTLTADLEVHATRSSVQSALDAVAGDAGRVLSAFGRAGVARRQLQTSSLQIYPHYSDHGAIDGYDASESITARITPLHHAGTTLSRAIAAAGNSVSVNDLSFDVVDDTAFLQQARTAAFADAHARAQQYAALSGRSLGNVEKISETVRSSSPPGHFADAAGAPAGLALKAVPIRAGEQPVAVTVTVVWDLK